MQKTEKARVGM